MQQQPEQDQFGKDLRTSVNLLYFLADAHSLCVTIFIRHSFGSNRPGFAGLLALFMMFMTMAEQHDIRMLWYLEVWFAVLIGQRLRTVYLVSRNWKEHSYYDGWPWLAMWVPFVRNEAQAKSLEPTLCLFIGLLLTPFSLTVGFYVMFGCVSLLVVRIMQLTSRRRQVVAMRDMEIEQRALSERIRGLRKDF